MLIDGIPLPSNGHGYCCSFHRVWNRSAHVCPVSREWNDLTKRVILVSDLRAIGHIPTGHVNIFAGGRNVCIAIPLPADSKYRVFCLVLKVDVEFLNIQPAEENDTKLGITDQSWAPSPVHVCPHMRCQLFSSCHRNRHSPSRRTHRFK
jgi:hypothetical protein